MYHCNEARHCTTDKTASKSTRYLGFVQCTEHKFERIDAFGRSKKFVQISAVYTIPTYVEWAVKEQLLQVLFAPDFCGQSSWKRQNTTYHTLPSKEQLTSIARRTIANTIQELSEINGSSCYFHQRQSSS